MKLFFIASLLFLSVIIFAILSSSPVVGISVPQWKFMGPGAALDVQPDGMDVSSAANDIVSVGTNAFLLATVNGGVWRTTDPVTTQRPHWTNVFDSQPVTCSSMTTFHVATTDKNTVYAACGASTSSQMGYKWNIRNSGDMAGFAVSYDAGLTWKMAAFPPNYSVEGILDLTDGSLLVAVRGAFFNWTDGGIWKSNDIFNPSSWKRVFAIPSFNLKYDDTTGAIFASTAGVFAQDAIYVSTDKGQTWTPKVNGLLFSGNQQPFYSVLAMVPGKSLFLGVMLGPQEYLQYGMGAGFGQVFYLDLTVPLASAQWVIVGGQMMAPNPANPTQDCSYDCQIPDCCLTVDNDYASKDRMGLFVIPGQPNTLYVSGNSGFLVFRVDWRRALYLTPCTYNYATATCFNSSVDLYIWKPMWNQGGNFRNDCTNNAAPHVDTRNINYDPTSGALLLVSDGGVFVRTSPAQENAGFWKGWNGDIGTFEYLQASYDIAQDRWIAAAQDNNVHVSIANAAQNPTANARAWTSGDGTWTTIDNNRTPARLYGANQFAYGLSYILDNFTGAPDSNPIRNSTYVPLETRGFPARNLNGANPRLEASFMPFFETPFHINPFNTNMLYVWANMSEYGAPSQDMMGFFKLDVTVADQGPNATLVFPTNGSNIIDFVVGGVVDGRKSEDVIVGVSGNTLFTRYNGVMTKAPLPIKFAEPLAGKILKSYCEGKQSQQIVPCTVSDQQTWPNHGKTMSVAIHPDNARIIAITGWPQLLENGGDEKIILTSDGGATWVTELIGDLVKRSETIGMARPSGLAFVRPTFLVVGTVNGNYAMDYTENYEWTRLGDFLQFPRVFVAHNNYYADNDTLIVATMGRGVYKLSPASVAITDAIDAFDAARRMSRAAKNLAITLGIVIPVVFVIVIAVTWIKTSKYYHVDAGTKGIEPQEALDAEIMGNAMEEDDHHEQNNNKHHDVRGSSSSANNNNRRSGEPSSSYRQVDDTLDQA